MRMSNGSLGDTAAGKVVNILSNDLQRFDLSMVFLHYVWIIPLQIAAVIYLGYLQAGTAAFIGFAALIIIALPFQGTTLYYIESKVKFNIHMYNARIYSFIFIVLTLPILKI